MVELCERMSPDGRLAPPRPRKGGPGGMRPTWAIAAQIMGLLTVLATCGMPSSAGRVQVILPPGAPLTEVAESLAARRIIKTPRAFTMYARMTGQTTGIKAGTYYLIPGRPIGQVVADLLRGPMLERLIVREGLRIAEISVIVERELGIPDSLFIYAASDSILRDRVGARGETLEGYLFPATYYFHVDAPADEVVHRLVAEFETRWRPEWNARLDTLGLTRDELVTLASIIEGEVRVDVDRPYVSSVYHNRLTRGMRLQADPTVLYALGERRRLLNRDYRFRSRYNTYLIDGLPPSPIDQPSEASIEAALYPLATDFLFFVAGPEGKHVFSRSYLEHLATIRKIRGPVARADGGR